MWGYGYQMQHDYFLHPLIMLFWVIVAIVIIAAVMRHHRRHHCDHHGRHGALEVLRERYAKGEIATTEFEERKKALIAE